jgi:monoamine oxidase
MVGGRRPPHGDDGDGVMASLTGAAHECLDVIVVGGGVAGLVAARDLAAAGRGVRLVEARERFGGRAWSAPFDGDGPTVELGGGWFDADLQRPLREEVDRYNIRVAPAAPYAAARWFTGGTLRRGLPVPVAEGGDLERVVVAINEAGRRYADADAAQRAAADVSTADWLDGLAPSAATRDFIYGWCGLMSGAPMDVTPISGLLGLVAEGGGAWAMASHLKHVFADGTNALSGALASDLGCPADLARPVVAIEQGDRGVVVRTRDGAALEARFCVLAVPVNVMGSLDVRPGFTAPRGDALATGHPCRPSKVWMSATGVPDGLIAAGWGTPLHWLTAGGTRHGDGQLVVGFAMEGAIDVTDREALEAALRVYAPDARVQATDTYNWNADPFSQGAWATPPAGWESAGILDALAAPHGRVLMAGSDVAAEHGGWIAGAIASGRETARHALALLAAEPARAA